jgi:hypothetical protein
VTPDFFPMPAHKSKKLINKNQSLWDLLEADELNMRGIHSTQVRTIFCGSYPRYYGTTLARLQLPPVFYKPVKK